MIARRRGYATEAASAVLARADEVFGEPVVLCTQGADARSLALAERLGFTEVARFEEFGAEQWYGVREPGVRRQRGGEFVGFVVLVEESDGMLLDNVAVLPSHHGQGLGRALLVLAERHARAAGHPRIRLVTHVTMVENQRLYERAGWSRPTARPSTASCGSSTRRASDVRSPAELPQRQDQDFAKVVRSQA